MGFWDDFKKILNNRWKGGFNVNGGGGNNGGTTATPQGISQGMGASGGPIGDTGSAVSAPIPQAAPPSLMEQLQQRLAGIQPHYTPLDILQKQANSTVNAQFDPQIQALLGEMSGTKTRATKNEGTAKSMYNALAQDFTSQLPGMQRDMKASQDAVTQRYQQAKGELQQQYDQQKNSQSDTLKQLGIQAASQDAQSQAATDQNYFQQQQSQDLNQTNDALQQQGAAQQDYQQNLASTSQQAGVNTAQDIASQLEQYLQGANSQLTGLKGQKSNSLAALMSQLQQADHQQAQTNYQNEFSNFMALNNFQLSASKNQNDAAVQAEQLAQAQQKIDQTANGAGMFKGTSGMSGMSNFLASKYGNNTDQAAKVSSIVSSVLSNPDVQNGQRNAGGINATPVTNEYLVQLIQQAAQQQGVTSGTDINNAIDALLAYKGQLR